MQLLLLIDLTSKKSYKTFLKDFPYLNSYFNRKIIYIDKTLEYCEKNNIHLMNCNYMKDRYGNNELISKYNFQYDLDKLPNFNKYKIVYFAGISLDECVTISRKLSYKNLLHNNKVLIRDCCIQGMLKGREQTKHILNEEDILNYELLYLQKMKIKYIKSLYQ